MRPSFSAVLLAGGRSTRMGRDKALLPLPGSQILLGQRQLQVLAELKPAEIFWSGAPRAGIPNHVRVVPDETLNAGPLGGIGACLKILASDLLVVLAIDLPEMKTAYLKNLLAACSPSCGVVMRHGDFHEPLAAIYPKAVLPLAIEHLQEKRFALQDLVREAVRLKLIHSLPLEEEDEPLFKNLNSPADL